MWSRQRTSSALRWSQILYFSGINVVICSVDPGIFDITLASEVEWVCTHTVPDVKTLLVRCHND